MAPPNLVLTTRDLTIKEKLNRSPLTRQEDEKFRAKWITLIKHSQNSKQRVPHETVRRRNPNPPHSRYGKASTSTVVEYLVQKSWDVHYLKMPPNYKSSHETKDSLRQLKSYHIGFLFPFFFLFFFKHKILHSNTVYFSSQKIYCLFSCCKILFSIIVTPNMFLVLYKLFFFFF